MPIKTKKLTDAMLAKGYTYIGVRNGHHWYEFTDVPSGKAPIRTYHSMGDKGKGLSDSLISKMRNQMHFESRHDFDEYAECRMSEREYRDSLRKRGFLSIRCTKGRRRSARRF